MNPDQENCQTQMNCLPMTFQYDECPASSSQEAHPMLSFDNLPRTQPDQQFLNDWSTNILSNNYDTSNPMAISQAPSEWTISAQISPDFDDQSANDYYGYSTLTSSSGNVASSLGGLTYAHIPRTWPLPYDPRMTNGNDQASKTYEPPAYVIDPNEVDSQRTSVINSGMAYDPQDSSQDFARLSISRGTRVESKSAGAALPSIEPSTSFRIPSRESLDDDGVSSREIIYGEAEEHGSDEPYAKLIYRALMSAPNHSMVLQEIYQWFRENTAKGSSDTKGWMNSIRHNLSMNAAFKKTERKVSGDDIKKSTEWVLEDFAVKDGVQSTTRYRKGTSSKKSIKSENLAPLRQSSGRKGGICAGKTRLQQHRQKVREERSDRRRSTQRLDTARHSQLQHQSGAQISQRDVSPMTPNPESMPGSSPYSPYFLPKIEQFEVPFEDICGLEGVQGVYIDGSPLFSNGHDSQFHHPHSMGATQQY